MDEAGIGLLNQSHMGGEGDYLGSSCTMRNWRKILLGNLKRRVISGAEEEDPQKEIVHRKEVAREVGTGEK